MKSRSKLHLLLWARYRTIRNSWLKRGRRPHLRLALAVLVWAWLFYWIGQSLFTTLSLMAQQDPTSPLPEKMVGGMFLAFLLLLFVSGATLATSTFFLSGEMNYLLTTPIPRPSVFSFRLLETALYNGTLFLVFAAPLIVVIGILLSASPLYYPLAAIAVLTFLVLTTDLGTLFSFLVVRVLPPKRAKELLSAVLALLFIAFWFGIQFLRTRSVEGPEAASGTQGIPLLQAWADRLPSGYLPSSWAAGALLAAVHNAWPEALAQLVILLVATVALHLATSRFSDALWLRGMSEGARPSPAASKQRRPRSLVGRGFAALFAREWKLLLRETQQLTRLLMLAGMAVLVPLLFRSSSASEGPWWSAFLVPALIGAIGTANVGALLYPLEGKAFWLIKVAPASIRRLVLTKTLVAWVWGTAVLSLAGLITSRYSPAEFLTPIPLVALSCLLALGLAAVGTLVGSTHARFDWDHPKRMLRGTGGLILSFGASTLVGLVFALGGAGAALLGLQGTDLVVLMLAITGALALTIFSLGTTLAISRLQKLEWNY